MVRHENFVRRPLPLTSRDTEKPPKSIVRSSNDRAPSAKYVAQALEWNAKNEAPRSDRIYNATDAMGSCLYTLKKYPESIALRKSRYNGPKPAGNAVWEQLK